MTKESSSPSSLTTTQWLLVIILILIVSTQLLLISQLDHVRSELSAVREEIENLHSFRTKRSVPTWPSSSSPTDCSQCPGYLRRRRKGYIKVSVAPPQSQQQNVTSRPYEQDLNDQSNGQQRFGPLGPNGQVISSPGDQATLPAIHLPSSYSGYPSSYSLYPGSSYYSWSSYGYPSYPTQNTYSPNHVQTPSYSSRGSPGLPGARGSPGSPGQRGSPGNPGIPGSYGNPGIPGSSGNPGIPGSPGPSAYTSTDSGSYSNGYSAQKGQRGSPGVPGYKSIDGGSWNYWSGRGLEDGYDDVNTLDISGGTLRGDIGIHNGWPQSSREENRRSFTTTTTTTTPTPTTVTTTRTTTPETTTTNEWAKTTTTTTTTTEKVPQGPTGFDFIMSPKAKDYYPAYREE